MATKALRWGTLLGLAVPAFSIAAAQVREPRIRDSANVQIVENASRATAPIVFRLGTKPILDLGGLQQNPDDEFSDNFSQLSGVLLRSGGVAVADAHRVIFFDRTGRRVRAVGQLGSGPNEFREISAMCATRGDTLVIADGTLSRYTIMTADGHIITTFQRDEARWAPAKACFDDGTFLATLRVAEAALVDRTEAQILRTNGRAISTRVRPIRVASSRDNVTQPIVSVIASGAQVYIGDGLESEYRVFDRTGTLTRIVRSADAKSPVSQTEVEEQLNASIPRNASASERSRRLTRLRSFQSRSTWPTFAFLFLDPSGRMWMQSYRRLSKSPFATESWAAFNADGRLEGRLVMPANVLQDRMPPQVVAFGNGTVLIKRIDDDGALRLTLYPIVRVGSER